MNLQQFLRCTPPPPPPPGTAYDIFHGGGGEEPPRKKMPTPWNFYREFGQILYSNYKQLGEGRKATSPEQLPNLILPICDSTRPHRASEPPPNSLPFIIVNF